MIVEMIFQLLGRIVVWLLKLACFSVAMLMVMLIFFAIVW